MKIIKNYSLIQINKLWFSLLIITTIILTSCNKDDEPIVQPLPETLEETKNKVYGQWRVLSGNLSFNSSKFIHFNDDNTIHLLEENNQGFKSDLASAITIEKDSITIIKAEQGPRKIGYQLKDDILILSQEFGSNVRLERATEIPMADEWIKTLTIQNKGNVSLGRVDIAYDGEYILGYDTNDWVIQKIDPNSFELGEPINTTGAFAIAIENIDHELRQMFTGGNEESTGFGSYIYKYNEFYNGSNGIVTNITGLASEKPGYIWAASSQGKELYYYKSNGSLSPGEVLQTFSLDFNPGGLDYHDDFLYIINGSYIHKCAMTTELHVVETFKIPGYYFTGITNDGANFILNAYHIEEDTYTLLRTNLSI